MIIKKITLFLFILGSLISCKIKNVTETVVLKKETNYIPYYLKVYEADSLYLVKNYQKSYEILDNLFQKYEPLNLERYKEYETYISCAHKLNKNLDYKKMIVYSIEFLGTNTKYIKYDSLFNVAFKKTNIPTKELELHTQKYRSKLNLKLRDSIIEICSDDQKKRQNGNSNLEDIRKIDSINEIRLSKIFESYDYPSEKLIGEFFIDSTDVNLRFVFLHTKHDFRINFLLPKVLKAVKLGKAYPEDYAESYDRYMEITTGKQLYGSYNLRREKQFTEFVDIKKIDSIRKSIGLPHLKYNRWRFKMKYGIDPYN
ncbi:MAG: hypothetical protein V4670_11775 [Bacteroidota bacterium]